MAQQTRSHGAATEEQGEYVEVEVTVHGTYIGKVKVKKGAKLQEILDAVIAAAKEQGIDIVFAVEGWTLLVDDEIITVNADGKVREEQNRVVTQNITLVLSQKVVGGIH